MKTLSRLARLVQINFVLIRYNLDEFIPATGWFYPVRFLSYANPYYWTVRKKLSRGKRVRLALEALGPIFIKAGQLLSTRRDVLPDDIAEELAKLQDRVPPFPGRQAKRIVEKALDLPLTEVFKDFQLEALASASIAQVHAATLFDGREVVAKVLRPQIKKKIDRDVDLLNLMANFAEKYSKDARRFKPKEIVAEISHTLYDELDLMREGANASQLRRNFLNTPFLDVPEIYWTYSSSNVLIMERMKGIPIYQVQALKDAGFDTKKIAERCIEIFFTQVFRDSFFHADMHPGNLFVDATKIEDPKILAVDFGIVGSLTSYDQRYLAENMLAFFKRDYQRVAELHVESGWLPPDTRIDQFEGAIRAVCEPIFERPLKDISFGFLLLRLFQTARRFNINIQPQLILLQKTLLNIEGLGRALYPELNLWETATPYLEKWLKTQVGVRAFFKKIRKNFPIWSEKLPEVPGLIFEILKQTQKEKEYAAFSHLKTAPKKEKSFSYFILGLLSGVVGLGTLALLLKLV